MECLLRVGAVVAAGQEHFDQDNGSLDSAYVVQELSVRQPRPGERERG